MRGRDKDTGWQKVDSTAGEGRAPEDSLVLTDLVESAFEGEKYTCFFIWRDLFCFTFCVRLPSIIT